MSAHLDSALVIVILLVWPVAKSLVYFGAAIVSVYSRNEERQAAARRVMRLIHHAPDDLDN